MSQNLKQTQTIKLGVVGYGGMGSYHVKGLIPADSEFVEVIGVYDIADEKQEAAKLERNNVYLSYEELLTDEAAEAVLIATPNDTHKKLAIQALKAGKHVICEKPVTLNLAEFDEVLAVAQEENQVFMVHQNRRWDPDFLLVRDLLEDQTMGDVFQIESRVHGANGIPGDWRHKREFGGGMLLDWGIHLLDQILWIAKSSIKDIKVDMSYILGDEVDDGFIVYLTFEDGLRALVEVGTTNFSSLPRWYVKGTKGTARIDDWDLSGEMVVTTGEESKKPTPIRAGVGLTKTMAPPVEGTIQKQALPEPKLTGPSFYKNFYEVVRFGAEPIVKNAEVRKVMGLIDEIFEVEEQ